MALIKLSRPTISIAAAFASTALAQFSLAGLAARALPAADAGFVIWVSGLAPLFAMAWLGLDKAARAGASQEGLGRWCARRVAHISLGLLLALGASGILATLAPRALGAMGSDFAGGALGVFMAGVWMSVFALGALGREAMQGAGRAEELAWLQCASMGAALLLSAAALAWSPTASLVLTTWLAPQALACAALPWALSWRPAGNVKDHEAAMSPAPDGRERAGYWMLSLAPLLLALAEPVAVAIAAPQDLPAYAMMGKFPAAMGLFSAGMAAAAWRAWRQAGPTRGSWGEIASRWGLLGVGASGAMGACSSILAIWLGPLADPGLDLLFPACAALCVRGVLEQALSRSWALLDDAAAARCHAAVAALAACSCLAGALCWGASGAMWCSAASSAVAVAAWSLVESRLKGANRGSTN